MQTGQNVAGTDVQGILLVISFKLLVCKKIQKNINDHLGKDKIQEIQEYKCIWSKSSWTDSKWINEHIINNQIVYFSLNCDDLVIDKTKLLEAENLRHDV